MRIKVLGCGNVLAGDDGVGLAVVKELKKRFPLLAGRVEIYEAGMPGLSLLELMIDTDKVILVDAVIGSPPGTVIQFDAEELFRNGEQSTGYLHAAGLRTSLAFAKKVIPLRMPHEIKIIGIKISQPVEWKNDLSPLAATAVPLAMSMVLDELGELDCHDIDAAAPVE